MLMQNTSMLQGDMTTPGYPIPKELEKEIEPILKACRDFGLDFFETIIEILDYDQMAELASYGGFPKRYPHWQWGMEYEEMSKGFQYGQYRIYEMVANVKPCRIYCLNSNTIVDHITVIAHATAHNDFFKNNRCFAPTNKNMINELANHACRIKNYMFEWGGERVQKFIDDVLPIETLVDPASAYLKKVYKEPLVWEKKQQISPERIQLDKSQDFLEDWINDRKSIEKQKEKIEKFQVAQQIGMLTNPQRDVFKYLRDNAPLRPWQQDVISMLYEESAYFLPQRYTKVANEGWACTKMDTLILTSEGIITTGDLVLNKKQLNVHDGECEQQVTDYFVFKDRRAITLQTERGYILTGSDNHRIIVNGEWKRLDEISINDNINLAVGTNLWASKLYPIDFQIKEQYGLKEIASKVGTSFDTIVRHKAGEIVGCAEKLSEALKDYKKNDANCSLRKKIDIPKFVDEDLAAFLGYMIGDGHISDCGRTLGLTTGDDEQADRFIEIAKKLFGINFRKIRDGNKWRVLASSKNLQDFLEYLGLPTGVSARKKVIPSCILQSPKSVVKAFLRAYYDCDGYGGDRVDLSTSSTEMSKQIQVLLLNFGIVSRRTCGKDENWHVTISGKYINIFATEIGFNLARKQNAIEETIKNRKLPYEMVYSDKVVSLVESRCDVVDMTVDKTHKYVAAGFINHNSFSDSKIMAEMGKAGNAGIYEYAIHKAGVLGGKYSTNPYKLGYSIFCEIEERWNKGKFGLAYNSCNDYAKKEAWDTKAGLGIQKVFDVRALYDDIQFIGEFFDEDFCRKYEFFEYRDLENGQKEVVSKDWKKIRHLLLKSRINGGFPDTPLIETNFRNKRIFTMQHNYDDTILDDEMTPETLESIARIWSGPVMLISKDQNEKEFCYYVPDKNEKCIRTTVDKV